MLVDTHQYSHMSDKQELLMDVNWVHILKQYHQTFDISFIPYYCRHQLYCPCCSLIRCTTNLFKFISHFGMISREVKIFNCMIANLFEEYKFFPKYPDKQLKLAAVLFGKCLSY